ncbi:MAG: mechanosensitive ion channel [Oscillospiraceae bacterium]|nr:mechanosensitive ion channel [Oscillospiraceae bacterium]
MQEFLNNLNRSNLVASLFVIVTTGIILHAVDRIYKSFTTRFGMSKGEKGTAVQVIYGLFRVFLIAGCIFSVLQIHGVDVSSMLAGVGLISAFVGLAVQDFLKDIVMGTRMLTDRFFEVGDVVQYGSFEGVVTEFDIRCTKIRSLSDGRILTVCNRNISEISAYPKEVGTAVTIPLPLTTDPKVIESSFTKAVKTIETAKGVNSVSYSGLTGLTERLGNYTLSLKCSPEDRAGCKTRALATLVEQLRKDGLIPFQ